MNHYLYTVYVDDNSKLCGFAPQTFEGIDSDAKDGRLVIYGLGNVTHVLNWSRVRWYTYELVETEQDADASYAVRDASAGAATAPGP